MSVECEVNQADVFVRALRLLHSRAKDSADQLKNMLDDVLSLRGTSANIKLEMKRPIKQGIETAVIKSPGDLKPTDKKPIMSLEKAKSESFESRSPFDKKRMRLESPQTSRSTSSSPTPPLVSKILPVEEKVVKVEEDSEATDIEEENTDAGEFALEMGLACVTCKGIDQTSNNQLVECQECHNLYHQECHKPPVVDQDFSDPRSIWYCAKCQKTMKKVSIKPNKGNNKSPVQTPSNVSSFKEMSVQAMKTPVKETPPDRLIQPFKRVESKVQMGFDSTRTAYQNMSNVSTSSPKPIGLAALANISRSSTTSSGSTSGVAPTAKSKSGNNNGSNGGASNTSSSHFSGGTSILSAVDKRMQGLKKKTSKQAKF